VRRRGVQWPDRLKRPSPAPIVISLRDARSPGARPTGSCGLVGSRTTWPGRRALTSRPGAAPEVATPHDGGLLRPEVEAGPAEHPAPPPVVLGESGDVETIRRRCPSWDGTLPVPSEAEALQVNRQDVVGHLGSGGGSGRGMGGRRDRLPRLAAREGGPADHSLENPPPGQLPAGGGEVLGGVPDIPRRSSWPQPLRVPSRADSPLKRRRRRRRPPRGRRLRARTCRSLSGSVRRRRSRRARAAPPRGR
jgi:hypothetical protein